MQSSRARWMFWMLVVALTGCVHSDNDRIDELELRVQRLEERVDYLYGPSALDPYVFPADPHPDSPREPLAPPVGLIPLAAFDLPAKHTVRKSDILMIPMTQEEIEARGWPFRDVIAVKRLIVGKTLEAGIKQGQPFLITNIQLVELELPLAPPEPIVDVDVFAPMVDAPPKLDDMYAKNKEEAFALVRERLPDYVYVATSPSSDDRSVFNTYYWLGPSPISIAPAYADDYDAPYHESEYTEAEYEPFVLSRGEYEWEEEEALSLVHPTEDYTIGNDTADNSYGEPYYEPFELSSGDDGWRIDSTVSAEPTPKSNSDWMLMIPMPFPAQPRALPYLDEEQFPHEFRPKRKIEEDTDVEAILP